MASCGCYDNSDVIATLIITHFRLYLIQLWWQFFQMFVYGVVVYAQKKLHRYWPWKTVSSHFHVLVRPMLLHRMALVSVRRFCKNLGNLQEFFGQTVYRPPWQKIARTPMRMIMFWSKLCKSNRNCAWNLAFISCIYLTCCMEYVWTSSLYMNRYISKSYTGSKNTIYRAGAAVESIITSDINNWIIKWLYRGSAWGI